MEFGVRKHVYAERYMNLDNKKIRILGAAQFQCLLGLYSIKKELDEYGLQENTSLILYAGSSRVMTNLDNSFENICEKIDKNLKKFYRPHPWLSDVK